MPKFRSPKDSGNRASRELVLAAAAFFVMLSFSALLAIFIADKERERFRVETEVTAEQVGHRLQSWIETRTALIEHLAERWPEEFDGRPDAFRTEAERFLRLYQGLQALNWIDTNWIIQQVNPDKGNEPALGKDLHNHPSPAVREAIHQASEFDRITRTPTIILLQSVHGFASYMPVRDIHGNPAGFLNAVFSVDVLIERCLPEQRLHERFLLRVEESDGSLVYSNHPEIPTGVWVHSVPVHFDVVNLPWTIRMAPIHFGQGGVAIAWIAFFAGLAVALLVTGLVYQLLLRQKSVRANEQRLRALFEGIQDIVFVHDMDGRILDSNQAACRWLGYSMDELIGMKTSQIDAPEFARGFSERLAKQRERGTLTCEGILLTRSGERIAVDINTSIIEFRGAPAVLAVVRDITMRKQAEEESRQFMARMQHAQKLESLGVLSGGIAHDFNNILMSIMGNASLALEDLTPDHPAHECVEEIDKASQLAAALCNQMLAYSGRGKFVVEPLCLNDLVEDTRRLLAVSISKHTSIKLELAKSLPLIDADATQLRQVILNLITNASESLEESQGTIELATGVAFFDRPYLEQICAQYLPGSELTPGEYVYVEVRDTGC